jgi:acetyl-CoA carboxylase biotin carboxyl carrier protein
MRLVALGAGASPRRRAKSESTAATTAGFDVVSPVDGVFYRGPGPQATPFVEVGSRLRVGQPIGLVEVMKTFNQVLYGAIGLPEEAVVLEVRCGDGEEVRAGQTLLVVRS